MNINVLPVIGWLLDLFFKASLAVPFWVCWTYFGLGAEYFYFLPVRYQAIGFWHCVGLFIIIGIIKPTLTPQFASISHECGKEK